MKLRRHFLAAALLALASSASAFSPFSGSALPGQADFDGSTNLASLASAFAGISDGKQGTVSAWVRFDGGDGAQAQLLRMNGAGTVPALRVQRSVAGTIQVQADNTASAVILNLTSVGTYTAGPAWVHLAASWNMAVPGAHHLYINGVSDETAPTFTDDTIDYTGTAVGYGGRTNGSNKVDGCLAEFFFHPVYVDLSVEANRLKFRTADGHPASLGADGSVPLGVQPILYIRARPDVNAGTGGQFTVTGAMAACSSAP